MTDFKNRLKAALKLPIGDYSSAMQQQLAIYRKGMTGNTGDLLKQQAQLQADIAQIQVFINTYGAANADTAKLAQLQQQLASVNAQLGSNSQLGVIVQEINDLVDHLVNQITGQPTSHKIPYSNDRTRMSSTSCRVPLALRGSRDLCENSSCPNGKSHKRGWSL